MAKDLDKELGFEPVSDESLGMEVSPEDKAKLQAYLKSQGPSMGASALAGAQQGLTLQHAPQLGAAMGAGLEKGAGMLGMGPQAANAKAGLPQQSLKDLYNEYLKSNQKRYTAAQETNPATFMAGELGGGILGAKGIGMAVAPAATALSQAAPGVAATAKIMNAAAPGAIPMGIAGGIAASGASNAPITSPQGAEDIAQGVAGGMMGSQLIPPAIQGIAAGAQKTGQGVKFLANTAAETATGGLGSKAFQRGLAGESLVGKKAAQSTADELLQFGKQVPSSIEDELNKLGAQKLAIIRSAQDAGVRIDPADLDAFVQTHLGSSSPSNLSNVQREMEEFHNLIKDAHSGPEVKQIVRRYFGVGNTEKGEFANLFAQKQGEQQALAADEPPPPTSQKEQFEQEFQQLRAEQQALPGDKNPTPMEMTYEPIEGQPDNVLGIIRQPQYDADGHFTGYKKIKSQIIEPDATPVEQPKLQMLMQPTDVPGKSLGIIRQAILDDKGNVTGYKKIASRLLSDDEAAMWKDMSETVRSGQTPSGEPANLTEPEQLYQLYKDLKQKSQYGDTSFKTPDVKAATGQAIEDIQGLLRKSIDELEPTDAKISALKQAQETINAQDKDPESIMKTFASLLGRTEDATISGADARNKLANLVNQIKIANPALGHQIESQAQNLADKFAITGAASGKVYLPRPLATPQALAAKGANILGYSIGQVTPEWMQGVAGSLARKGGQAAQALSNVLTKAAEKDPQTRNSIMFGLMQQPGYRDILKDYMPTQQQTSEGGIKNKQTEQFK